MKSNCNCERYITELDDDRRIPSLNTECIRCFRRGQGGNLSAHSSWCLIRCFISYVTGVRIKLETLFTPFLNLRCVKPLNIAQ